MAQSGVHFVICIICLSGNRDAVWELQRPGLLPCIKQAISNFSLLLLQLLLPWQMFPMNAATAWRSSSQLDSSALPPSLLSKFCLCAHVTCRSY